MQGEFYSRNVIFTFFLDIQQPPLNVNLEIIYNIWCGLGCGIFIYLDIK